MGQESWPICLANGVKKALKDPRSISKPNAIAREVNGKLEEKWREYVASLGKHTAFLAIQARSITMKRRKECQMSRSRERMSDYQVAKEAAKRLLNPQWVKRYAANDADEGARQLAVKFGLAGRHGYLRELCQLFREFPEPASFEAALADRTERGKRRLIEKLAECEVNVPMAWLEKTEPSRIFVGECYRKACYFVSDHNIEGARLVHGRISDFGVDCSHAWVELPGEIVFDGVTQRFYRRDRYYEVRSAIKERCNTAEEALINSVRHRNFGPWHEQPD